MDKAAFFIQVCILFAIIAFLPACQEQIIETQVVDELVLKKQGIPSSSSTGDLYGDLWQQERYVSGAPILYPLKYVADFQDSPVSGTIDVVNPRLSDSFTLQAIKRDENGDVIFKDSHGELSPDSIIMEITPVNGFVTDTAMVVALYDSEGEILEEVANYVFPVEEGRLNIVRSPTTVINRRLAEVIKNFGDGSVANVVRDYCGRLFMVRVDDSSLENKPIDSPLENLAIYKELMLHGFDRSAVDNGLKFLVEQDIVGNDTLGSFYFQSRLDENWTSGAVTWESIENSSEQQRQFVANLAASCVAAGSDKSNFLNIDEIVFLNLFMGIPSGIDGCFFPVVQQNIRSMNKTNKSVDVTTRYYVDYTDFSYNRTKFDSTLVDLCTIVENSDGSITVITLQEDLSLGSILEGEYSEGDLFYGYQYTQLNNVVTTGAEGFANQADDYVQALELVHNNEEFLVWQIPTPTWANGTSVSSEFSPFTYMPGESDHGKKPDGVGDDSSDDIDSSNKKSGHRGRRR